MPDAFYDKDMQVEVFVDYDDNKIRVILHSGESISITEARLFTRMLSDCADALEAE